MSQPPVSPNPPPYATVASDYRQQADGKQAEYPVQPWAQPPAPAQFATPSQYQAYPYGYPYYPPQPAGYQPYAPTYPGSYPAQPGQLPPGPQPYYYPPPYPPNPSFPIAVPQAPPPQIQPAFQQAQAPLRQPSPQPIPAQQPQTLQFVSSGRDSMSLMTSDRRQALYTVHYESSTFLRVSRGGSGGATVGSATFHNFTTDKADIEIGGRAVRFKKELASAAGLGQLRWRTADGGGLQLDGAQGPLAEFALAAGREAPRHEGRLEIRAWGLGQAQLDEIVVSGVAELERRRRDAKYAEAGFFGGLAGGAAAAAAC